LKKLIRIILIFALIFFILTIIFDLINITRFIPLSSKYDWLGFIGTFISGLATLILGIVSIKQNKALSEANKKMLNNDMISNCFSKIDIEKTNYMDNTKTLYNADYGIELINPECTIENKYYHKLILQINDSNDLPLSFGYIRELKIEHNYTDDLTTFRKESIYKPINEKYIKLEVTPSSNKITYYLPICLLDDAKNLKEIENNNSLRITFYMSIKNSFNVISNGEYTIVLNKGKLVSDWTEYTLYGRKIYFKDIVYEDKN